LIGEEATVKTSVAIAVFCLLCSQAARPQAGSQSPQTSQPKAGSTPALRIDPAKEADIRRLLDLTGAKAMASQTMSRMEGNIRPLLTSSLPPGDYRDKLVNLFFAKFHSKLDMQIFLDKAVVVYDKYLTAQDVRGLIQFYETPVGQKAITVLPKMSAELGEQGEAWGRQMGRDSMLEVLQENPDLAKALDEAKQRQQPQ
jgi:hypothetical protein